MSKSELLTLFNLKRYFYSIIINQFNQNNRKSYFFISIIHLENELTDTMKFCMQYKSDIFFSLVERNKWTAAAAISNWSVGGPNDNVLLCCLTPSWCKHCVEPKFCHDTTIMNNFITVHLPPPPSPILWWQNSKYYTKDLQQSKHPTVAGDYH